MLEYVWRFSVEKGRYSEFTDWLVANDQRLREQSQPGWTYLGTWMTVVGFGRYSGEVRWSLEGCESLGGGWGDEAAQELMSQLIEMIDTVHGEANLLRPIETLSIPPGI